MSDPRLRPARQFNSGIQRLSILLAAASVIPRMAQVNYFYSLTSPTLMAYGLVMLAM